MRLNPNHNCVVRVAHEHGMEECFYCEALREPREEGSRRQLVRQKKEYDDDAKEYDMEEILRKMSIPEGMDQ